MFAASPILILGGGINGTAVAREFAAQGRPVVLVEARDLAFGASSKSSRLIHGGLRYLEYGDVDLVRESLDERNLLLTTAAHLIEPLRLFIPGQASIRGLVRAAVSFAGWQRSRVGRWLMTVGDSPGPRGYWPVRLGLWLYDWLAASRKFPRSSAPRPSDRAPTLAPGRYRWLLGYSDAQMLYPERWVIEQLLDAVDLARDSGSSVEVYVPASVHWLPDGQLEIVDPDGQRLRSPLRPELIVNASGPWGDRSLAALAAPASLANPQLTTSSDLATTPPPRLIGGTRGSHLVTWNPELIQRLNGQAVYAEADDGRMVFILPFDSGVLVGTTDLIEDGDPGALSATPAELDYLRAMVAEVFKVSLTPRDIALHYCGVRPLPAAQTDSTAAISRGHAIDRREIHGTPIWTLIGGKLTTCRAFAEQLVRGWSEQRRLPRAVSTRQRPLPGALKAPPTSAERDQLLSRWVNEWQITPADASWLWRTFGMRTERLWPTDHARRIHGTPLPVPFVAAIIQSEWVSTLDDLVERRLMLVFRESLTRTTLVELADVLVACQRLSADERDLAVARASNRLATYYGRVIPQDS